MCGVRDYIYSGQDPTHSEYVVLRKLICFPTSTVSRLKRFSRWTVSYKTKSSLLRALPAELVSQRPNSWHLKVSSRSPGGVRKLATEFANERCQDGTRRYPGTTTHEGRFRNHGVWRYRQRNGRGRPLSRLSQGMGNVSLYRPLDVAVILAGVVGKEHFQAGIHEIDDTDWDVVMDVNTNGIKRSCVNRSGTRRTGDASSMRRARAG